MTFALFIIAFIAFFFTILNALPVSPLPTEIAESIALIVSYMRSFEFLLPFIQIYNALLFVISVQILIFFWKAVKWTIGIVRGGTSS